MRARRRIGLGVLVSGVLHAAAAVTALWLGAGERTDGPDPGELVWADIELIEDSPGAAPVSPPQVLDPAAPVAPLNPAPVPARKTATDPAPDTGSPIRAQSPSATMAMRSRSDPGAESATAIGTGRERRPATEAGSTSESGEGAESPVAGRPDLDPRSAAAAVQLDPGPPPPRGVLDRLRMRKPPRQRSELRPDGPQGFVTDEGVFVARTDRDGRVVFEDRSSVRVDLPTPRQLVKGIARELERWSRDPRGYVETGRSIEPRIPGQIELTDMMMRAGGEDPYSARKMAFLDRTRAERMQSAARENSQRLRESLHRTRAELERLWRGPGSAAHRRRLLFLLWDECAETGSDEVVRAARAVRGQIIAFVRRQLPAGSRLAYGESELARHNARRTSRERFDPYAPRD
jgi:hypothetical protein